VWYGTLASTVDTENLEKAVTAEFVAKRGKKPKVKRDAAGKTAV
jgi:hypothetical protein